MAGRRFEGLRVLVVEDEMVVAMLLEDMLGELGCKVVAMAARLTDAMTAAATLELDAAILDVNLDGQRSDALADMLAERGIPFLFSSGYGGQAIHERHRHRPLVGKPFSDGELAEALSRALAS